MSRMPNPIAVEDHNAERPVHVEEMHATFGDALPRVEEVRHRIEDGAREDLQSATTELKKSFEQLFTSLKLVAKAARSYARVRGLSAHLPRVVQRFVPGSKHA
jgi:hypothetical protein